MDMREEKQMLNIFTVTTRMRPFLQTVKKLVVVFSKLCKVCISLFVFMLIFLEDFLKCFDTLNVSVFFRYELFQGLKRNLMPDFSEHSKMLKKKFLV